ncbi:hypothetical protein HYU19_04495 [Candidatus Woesearchaeota archaeon]|nr:hypothetical protein [Candidatus Woesearchaeota archaeon]
MPKEEAKTCSDSDDEDYDLLPHHKLMQLEKELDALKKNPLGSTASGRSFEDSMNRLSKSMDALVSLFKTATCQMEEENKEAEETAKKFDPVVDKLNVLIDQNQKIAKGMVALADLLEEQQKHLAALPPSPRPAAPLPPPPIPPGMGSPSLPRPPMPAPLPDRPPAFSSNPFDEIPAIGGGGFPSRPSPAFPPAGLPAGGQPRPLPGMPYGSGGPLGEQPRPSPLPPPNFSMPGQPPRKKGLFG